MPIVAIIATAAGFLLPEAVCDITILGDNMIMTNALKAHIYAAQEKHTTT